VALLLVRWWQCRPIRRFDVLALLPFLALGAVMGAITGRYEKYHVIGELGVAVSPEWHLTILQRAINAGRALWFYACKLIWPHPLNFNYSRWEIDAAALTQWLWPLTALGLAALLWAMRKHWGRGPLAAGLFFAISVAPALGFVNVAPMRYSFVADHFDYLPSIGVIAGVIGVAYWLLERLMAGQAERASTIRIAAGALAAVVVLALAITAFERTKSFMTVETLWRDTIAKNPKSWLARMNLGVLLRRRGDNDEAEMHFRQILADWPTWWEPTAGAHINLGNICTARGELEGALTQFQTAVEISPRPGIARFNLANTLMAQGRDSEAIEQYQQLLKDVPQYPKAHLNFALALEKAGDSDQAADQYRAALKDDPNLLQAYIGLGNIAQRKGQGAEAVAHFQEALNINPAALQARLPLAQIMLQSGENQQAINILRDGLAIIPDATALYVNLSRALKMAGDEAGVTQALREGAAHNPNNPQLVLMLADHLATSSSPAERNGAEALHLAESVRDAGQAQNPFALNTLAAAYAEVGRFDDARRAAAQALQIAQSQHIEALIGQIAARLKSYKANQAVHSEGAK